jgi:Transglutaminase-like superfamily
MMSRLLKFLSLPRREKQLFCEAGILLLLSNLSVKAVPFRHIDSFLRARAHWHDRAACPFSTADEIELIKLSLSRVAKLLPWENLCLSRSIAEFIMFRRRGIPAVMYVGARFSENSSLVAHAWVCTGREATNGNLDNSTYTPLVIIGQEQTIH